MPDTAEPTDCRDCGAALRPGYDSGGICWRCLAAKASLPAQPKPLPTGTHHVEDRMDREKFKRRLAEARAALHGSDPDLDPAA